MAVRERDSHAHAADYRKQARHRARLSDQLEAVRDPGLAVDQQAIVREELDRVARALDALDLDRRAIFVLHEIDGVSVPEAALALGVPINTAYSRLRLGRADFEAAVRRLEARRPDSGGKR